MNSSNELTRPPALTHAYPLSSHALNMVGYAPQRELAIRDLFSILTRRKGIILFVLTVVVGLGMTVFALSTRRYMAKATVQVQKENAGVLDLDNMISSGTTTSDALDANIALQTQAEVLKSDSLSLKVIKGLDLEHNADFQPHFNLIGWALGFLAPNAPLDPKNVPLEDQPGRRSSLVAKFQKNLTVKPISGTRMIEVSYLNPDPKVAATVVNYLVQALMDFNFQTRFNATQQAAGWLGNQLSDLRKQSEELRARVVTLQHESGVFTFGQKDMQGHEQLYLPTLDRLQRAETQLSEAESSRILKGALYQVVKDGDPERISGLAGNNLATASTGTANSLGLIQSLRAQESTIQAQLDELSTKFGSAYPKISQLRAEKDGIQKSILAEASRVAGRVTNDYLVAQKVEDTARQVVESEKKEASVLNDKASEYQIVHQEADQSRALYENLLRRLKEAGVVAGLRSSNIILVDPGRIPARPAKPNALSYLAGSIVAGLFLGSCGALLRESLDTKIRDLSELEAHLGTTILGILPFNRQSNFLSLPAVSEPHGAYAEAVRIIRTALRPSRLDNPPQVILITSANAGEGKTMLCSNLATLLATQGKRVLLVDGDLRCPSIHRRFKIRPEEGLSTLLSSDDAAQKAMTTPIRMPAIAGLSIVVAGPPPQFPAELLGSDRMGQVLNVWRQNYDFIVLDGAPVLPVTDSVLLHELSDFTIVLACYKMTERQSLERAYAALQAKTPGKAAIVVNAVHPKDNTYHRYFGYKNGAYHGEKKYV